MELTDSMSIPEILEEAFSAYRTGSFGYLASDQVHAWTDPSHRDPTTYFGQITADYLAIHRGLYIEVYFASDSEECEEGEVDCVDLDIQTGLSYVNKNAMN